MLSGISNLKWEMVQNPSQRLHTLFTGAEKVCNLACCLFKTCCSKPLPAFVKVVEGSEMSKFGIQTVVHFSSKIVR
jgi:hypothetical protein